MLFFRLSAGRSPSNFVPNKSPPIRSSSIVHFIQNEGGSCSPSHSDWPKQLAVPAFCDRFCETLHFRALAYALPPHRLPLDIEMKFMLRCGLTLAESSELVSWLFRTRLR